MSLNGGEQRCPVEGEAQLMNENTQVVGFLSLLVWVCSFWRRDQLHGQLRNVLEVARRVQVQISGVRHDGQLLGHDLTRDLSEKDVSKCITLSLPSREGHDMRRWEHKKQRSEVNKCVEAITTISLQSKDAVRGHSSPRFGSMGKQTDVRANQGTGRQY